MSSTLQEFWKALDAEREPGKPIFFYAQPMNVHMLGVNDVIPPQLKRSWSRPGFSPQISLEVHMVDAFFGDFVDELRRRGLYDDSIIIVTSDHGDATGELGRRGHSLVIYPEIMRVPLLIHLPAWMRGNYVQDPERTTLLTDITPTLYYLLGHRPILHGPLLGTPIVAESKREIDSYERSDIFLASDTRDVFGILSPDRRYLYAAYDAPARSELFDLNSDPNAQHNIVSPELKQKYDGRILGYLRQLDTLYGHEPTSMAAAAARQSAP
jgi:arylsulfatase A-like enzyme